MAPEPAVAFSPPGRDQDELLDNATTVVKEQAFLMKRSIDGDNVPDALKHSSNMIGELRSSQLSPKNYYELYTLIFKELSHLTNFLDDSARHQRKYVDLYESVQYAGHILPRLYLLCTAGASYIKSKEAPAKEILTDVHELCKGVQHPLRGLFLRYFVSQMMKDKLPDVGSEYEGAGGDMKDAFEFVFNNLVESNSLWSRMLTNGPARERAKREKERHDLRALVGANLVRLSQLGGMTAEFYEKTALPQILEYIVATKDATSQQYIFESIIQVFPDEFHLRTVEVLLGAYRRALVEVDLKPVLASLMTRLGAYLANKDNNEIIKSMDIFVMFRSNLQQILEKALDPASAATADLPGILQAQAAFLHFTVSLYPEKVEYVDIILGSTVDILKKYFENTGGNTNKLTGASAEKAVELIAAPMQAMLVSVLEMKHFPTILDFLDIQTRKKLAQAMVKTVAQNRIALAGVESLNRLFDAISPLLKDEEGSAPSYDESFAKDQQEVGKIVHLISHDDVDAAFAMLTAARGSFGQGGAERMKHTLPSTVTAALSLIPTIQAREAEGASLTVSVKKTFQFVHKTITAMVQVSPDTALRLWLLAGAAADRVDRVAETPGAFEPICYEFLTQALLCLEEEISETMKQYQGIFVIVGLLVQTVCLDAENFDAVAQKVAQHAARLLKKPLQIRAVSACASLFWCEARRDGKRALECLQKCLKITDAMVQSDAKQVGIWVEMLDRYIFFFESGCETVSGSFIQSLINLCTEHIAYAAKDAQLQGEATQADQHLQQTLAYLKRQKASSNADVAGKFAEITAEGQ